MLVAKGDLTCRWTWLAPLQFFCKSTLRRVWEIQNCTYLESVYERIYMDKKNLATSYSATQSPMQYHRRWGA